MERKERKGECSGGRGRNRERNRELRQQRQRGLRRTAHPAARSPPGDLGPLDTLEQSILDLFSSVAAAERARLSLSRLRRGRAGGLGVVHPIDVYVPGGNPLSDLKGSVARVVREETHRTRAAREREAVVRPMESSSSDPWATLRGTPWPCWRG